MDACEEIVCDDIVEVVGEDVSSLSLGLTSTISSARRYRSLDLLLMNSSGVMKWLISEGEEYLVEWKRPETVAARAAFLYRPQSVSILGLDFCEDIEWPSVVYFVEEARCAEPCLYERT